MPFPDSIWRNAWLSLINGLLQQRLHVQGQIITHKMLELPHVHISVVPCILFLPKSSGHLHISNTGCQAFSQCSWTVSTEGPEFSQNKDWRANCSICSLLLRVALSIVFPFVSSPPVLLSIECERALWWAPDGQPRSNHHQFTVFCFKKENVVACGKKTKACKPVRVLLAHNMVVAYELTKNPSSFKGWRSCLSIYMYCKHCCVSAVSLFKI